ncbi:MAG: hypothetical protein ACREVK_12170, partial [Gammaproteobacteria bacterium]
TGGDRVLIMNADQQLVVSKKIFSSSIKETPFYPQILRRRFIFSFGRKGSRRNVHDFFAMDKPFANAK